MRRHAGEEGAGKAGKPLWIDEFAELAQFERVRL